MRQAPGAWIAVALGFLLLASGVEAANGLEGDGFRMGVPAGFVRLAARDALEHASDGLDFTAGLSIEREPELHVFRKGRERRPDALLFVMRVRLVDRTGMATTRDLQRYMLDRLHVSDDDFEQLVASDAVTLTPRIHDGYDALHMSHGGVRGPMELMDEPATRALTVLGEDTLLVVLLHVTDDEAVPVESAWQAVAGSLVVDPPGAFARSALLYGGFSLVGLILCVLLLRLLGRRRLARDPVWNGGQLASGESSWGHSVLAPPLHPAGGRPMGGGSGASMPLRHPEPTPEPETAHVPAPIAPPQRAPTPSTRLQPAVRAAPTPAVTPAASVASPAPVVAAPAARSATAPTAKAGLKRTLPKGGRYSS